MTRKVNKSAVIREMHKQEPSMGPTEMSVRLAKQGIKVTAATISTILSTHKKRGGVAVGKPGRPPGSVKAKSTDARPVSRAVKLLDDTAEVTRQLIAAKRLVTAVGGYQQARKVITMLENLDQVG